MKSSFQSELSIIHWDGKLLPELTNLNSKKFVNQLPVLISSLTGECQLLGVPKLQGGTGQNQAEAVFNLLEEWGLHHCVIRTCFDTTAANNGRVLGACVLLEQELQKGLFYIACKHHIMELVISSTFCPCYSPLSGPYVQLFN